MRIAFRAAPTIEARRALAALQHRYGALEPEEAQVIVALGGDGSLSAVELVDRTMIDLARANPAFAPFMELFDDLRLE